MQLKKVLAVVMSLCMVAGAVSYGAPVISQAIAAQAAEAEEECCFFDETTGVFTLRGEVDDLAVKRLSEKNWNKVSVKSVIAEEGTVLPKDCSKLFSGFVYCESIDLSKADTSNVENMQGMFELCYDLKDLDISGFNTKKVENMSGMFLSCNKLSSLDLSGFDTGKVTEMQGMFAYCNGLTYLDVSSFDTSNVTKMNGMFDSCYILNELTLGEKYPLIPDTACLPKGNGWVNTKDPAAIISGERVYAVIENNGRNTYVQYTNKKPTCPTKIRVEYSEKYHQVRFKWNKVEDADRYGIAVYLAGKWRIQTQDITDNVYTSPKNLLPGKTYKVAIAARVNGSWDTKSAIRNAVTITVK